MRAAFRLARGQAGRGPREDEEVGVRERQAQRVSGSDARGQGGFQRAGRGCFKWPWDPVAIVPTTVQALHFVADQITNEKVGVKVTGIAVYRIADPLIAFRMLNFSHPARAQQKLPEMLEEMFIGSVRPLVANSPSSSV